MIHMEVVAHQANPMQANPMQANPMHHTIVIQYPPSNDDDEDDNDTDICYICFVFIMIAGVMAIIILSAMYAFSNASD